MRRLRIRRTPAAVGRTEGTASIAFTERTANVLVNRRMSKLQQMRWSRRGADMLLHVQRAVCNGTFGSGSGQRFQPANGPDPQLAVAT